MMLRLIGIGTVFALVAVSYSLLLTKGALDTERLHHAATALERDQWKTAAEAYRTRKRRRKMPACAWTGRQKPRETRRNEHLL